MPVPCPTKGTSSWNCQNCNNPNCDMCYEVVKQLFIDKGLPSDLANIIAQQYKYSNE